MASTKQLGDIIRCAKLLLIEDVINIESSAERTEVKWLSKAKLHKAN